MLKLTKRAAGRYSTTVRFVEYTVEHIPSNGWRWAAHGYGAGGEWRSTKREAVLDLAAYLYSSTGGR